MAREFVKLFQNNDGNGFISYHAFHHMMPFVVSLQQTFKRALSKHYFFPLHVDLEFVLCKISKGFLDS